MHSRFVNPAIASWAIASAAVLAFLGCEWGGAHENTWNDGYSWANFTGTYRFVNAIYYTPIAAAPADTSARLNSALDFAKPTDTTVNYPVYNGAANGNMASQTSAGGSLLVVNGLVAGSVSMTVSCSKGNGGTATLSSDNNNNLIYKGQVVGNVTSSGAWQFQLPIKANANAGDPIGITYKYYGKAGGGGSSGGGSSSSSGGSSSSSGGGSSSSSSSSGGSSSGGSSGGSSSGGSSSSSGGGSSSSSSSGGETPDNAVYLSFLKVTQQGNKLTMISDRGIVYKGQLTGASTSKDGYVAAQQVRLSFEVTSASGMKITGHFSGVWSGASDKNYGVLSDRTIQGTHNRAGNFVGVAADTTIKVPNITISEVGVNSVDE